jgi:outer membrane protein assembly factor BamB
MEDQKAEYSFEELAIWRTKLPKVKHAVLPPSTNRPNPLIHKGILFVSVFSSGAVCALDTKNGQMLWRRELPSLGSDSVHLAEGKLFAKTATTLYALEPRTGATIWSFCPYGESGEMIYSHPALHSNNLFIGDRCGYLHCLDSRTGKTNWKVLTNTEKNSDVNSTPIVTKGLVIVATNAKMVAAYAEKSGKRVWARNVDGPSSFGPLLFRRQLTVVTESVYLLKPDTGEIIRKLSWKGDAASSADCTQRSVVCILRGSWPPDGTAKLIGLDESGIHFTQSSTAYVAFVRYAKETKLIYVSHLHGIDVRRQSRGVLAFRIRRSKISSGISQVDVAKKRIYVLTGDGYVYALRHPSVPRSWQPLPETDPLPDGAGLALEVTQRKNLNPARTLAHPNRG